MSVLRESKSAPSTFAALLRSSRFASYDPKIAQIYTTYDGHAHRGNWGLKRPLALRRKSGAFIVVKSIDSREQQTEWYRAEQEARWMYAFSELGKDVEIRQDSGSWYEYMGDGWQKTYDSDYNLDSKLHSPFGPNVLERVSASDGWRSTSMNRTLLAQVPNPSSMTPKQFRRFLAQLRGSHHRFKSFVESEVENTTKKSQSKSNRSTPVVLNQFNAHLHRSHLIPRFLRNEALRPFFTKGSTKLLPSPHHNASLSYSHTSDLTNKILHSPVPGRIFSSANPRQQHDSDIYTVGVAGLLGKLIKDDALKRQATKLSDQRGHAIPVLFRAKHAMLSHAPRVVNAPVETSGFKASHVQLEFVEDAKLRSQMTNPYSPGSQAYIAHHDPIAHSSKSTTTSMAPKSQQRKAQSRIHHRGKNENQRRENSGQRLEEMINTLQQGTSYNFNLD